jgi:hypothetical protein
LPEQYRETLPQLPNRFAHLGDWIGADYFPEIFGRAKHSRRSQKHRTPFARGKFFQGGKLRKSSLDRRFFERVFPAPVASKGTIALCGMCRCTMGDTAMGSS